MTSLASLRVVARSLAHVASYPRGATFGPRILADYELVWVIAGEGLWTTSQSPGETLRVSPGTLNLARRGSTEHYAWTHARESRHAFVHFAFGSDSPWPGEAEWPVQRSLDANPVLAALCDYLMDLAASGTPNASTRTDEVLTLLIDLFIAGPLEGELVTPLGLNRPRFCTAVF